jgi:hypothetical protein
MVIEEKYVNWQSFFNNVPSFGMEKIELFFLKALRRLGSGAFRTTSALNDDWIIKIPRSYYSMIQNIIEYLLSKQHPQYFPYTFLYMHEGVPVLVAEMVTRKKDYRGVFPPSVVGDGYYQCGMTKEKRFVCYDAGNEEELVLIEPDLFANTIKTAPQLPSYDQLLMEVNKEWSEAKKWIRRIPYTRLTTFPQHMKTV